MKTTIACISDLHGTLADTTHKCDILVIAGDICPATNHTLDFQSRWLRTDLGPWLDRQPAAKIIATWGNHDWIGERAPDLVPSWLRWTMLSDERVEYRGLKFWGSPWQKRFMDGAFNFRPPFLSLNSQHHGRRTSKAQALSDGQPSHSDA